VDGQAFEPRLSAEALEDRSGLGEEWLGPLRVSFLSEPLRVLKEGHGEPEGNQIAITSTADPKSDPERFLLSCFQWPDPPFGASTAM
jgi:hypothetical protein